MRKKRILFVGEFPGLATGYGGYAKEVLSRLTKTNKYEIAQLAAYGREDDPSLSEYGWRIYPNTPAANSELLAKHQENPFNQFGAWRFEDTVIDFKPDIVFSIADIWMNMFLAESPFRRFYHLTLMPPVDSKPQEKQWLSVFKSCNSICTYTDWGLNVLKEQAGDDINLIGSFPPGSDVETFKPFPNKIQIKQAMGLHPESVIIGTTVRNQKRKLIPDLINTFKSLLTYAATHNPKLAEHLYLYLHTSYPDAGWRLSLLLAESGIGHRVLFTYFCKNCKAIYPSLFQDIRGFCNHCKQPTMCMTNTMHGLPTFELAKVYNAMDVYVQYFNREGFGMPLTEAAACGVPVMAVDYAGPADIVRKLKGQPISVKSFIREVDLHAFAAVPDNADLQEKLYKFLTLPQGIRLKKGFETRQAVLQHYTWDRTAKLWENHFDSVAIKDHSLTWLSPPRFHIPPAEVPGNLSISNMVRWGICNVLKSPEDQDSYVALQYVRDLNFAGRINSFSGVHFDDASFLGQRPTYTEYNPQLMFNELYEKRQALNFWENRRINWNNSPKPDFINIAHHTGK
jgi:glycosyltransferase involved in cell wall biosynthesis